VQYGPDDDDDILFSEEKFSSLMLAPEPSSNSKNILDILIKPQTNQTKTLERIVEETKKDDAATLLKGKLMELTLSAAKNKSQQLSQTQEVPPPSGEILRGKLESLLLGKSETNQTQPQLQQQNIIAETFGKPHKVPLKIEKPSRREEAAKLQQNSTNIIAATFGGNKISTLQNTNAIPTSTAPATTKNGSEKVAMLLSHASEIQKTPQTEQANKHEGNSLQSMLSGLQQTAQKQPNPIAEEQKENQKQNVQTPISPQGQKLQKLLQSQAQPQMQIPMHMPMQMPLPPWLPPGLGSPPPGFQMMMNFGNPISPTSQGSGSPSIWNFLPFLIFPHISAQPAPFLIFLQCQLSPQCHHLISLLCLYSRLSPLCQECQECPSFPQWDSLPCLSFPQ